MLVKFIYEHDNGTDFLFVNYIEKKFVFIENMQKSDSIYKEQIDDGCIRINFHQLTRLLFDLTMIGKFEARGN